MAQIELKNVHKSYGELGVIKGIDLEIRKGEFMVFVGPSGCGKSTLLRMICGLEEITNGELEFDGKRVNDDVPSKRGIAMVFQSYALYPHMSVYDNMAFGLKLAKENGETIDTRVNRAAQMLQIEHLLDRKPRQLSGGQRQRVAIGRAITRNPRVFLFDEPLSNLDAALRVATRLEIAKLHREMNGSTMIYVTHDQVEAMTLADRICVLRDGVVEQVGTPDELYERPASVFVAGFIGSPKMNLLSGAFAEDFGCTTYGLRPEHVEIVDETQGIWAGDVVHLENLGADQFLFVDIGADEPMIVRMDTRRPVTIGSRVDLKPQTGQGHRFDASDRAIAGSH